VKGAFSVLESNRKHLLVLMKSNPELGEAIDIQMKSVKEQRIYDNTTCF
jgi:hypothetical protein